ncbi:MAG: cation:proton antiporter, partial [Antricoccus sp.]
MTQAEQFALAVFLVGAIGIAAVLSNWITERVRVPVPALVLIASAIAVQVIPGLHEPPELDVERVVTVALLFILFDGGMHIGWRRFRGAATPIGLVGIVGTFLTAAGGAALLHLAFGFSWYAALLVATAVSPTDPAVVFSVLGKREIAGRSGTILEGESGANDPVGIALMASLLAVGELTGGAFGKIGLQFILQMAIGAAVGVFGGRLLLLFMRRVPLPSEALYPIRTLLCVPILYGAT